MRRPLTPLALLAAACSLRPYTFDSASGDASSTTTSSPASTTGTTSTTSTTSSVATSTTTAATTTGGAVPGTWQGLYRHYSGENVILGEILEDCATQQVWQIRGQRFPSSCGAIGFDSGLYLHVSGVLSPDGDDDDALDELEITEVLAACLVGFCDDPSEWSSCGPFPELCGTYKECDPWQQNCPEGQKCMPFSGDGDNSWESLKCVPVAPGAGQAGDPCTAEGGGVSGVDTCAKGHMCWNLDFDAMGTCLPQCTGSPNKPMCPGCMGCFIAGDGIIQLCFPDCDPLAQDCPYDDPCVPSPEFPDRFHCSYNHNPDDSALLFAPCEHSDMCDPGLWCAPPEHASECDPNAPGCCLPFCDLTQPACPGAGLQCIPWNDQAPPCSANVGTCRLPP